MKRAGERENQIIQEAQQEAVLLKKKAEESIELEKKKAVNDIKKRHIKSVAKTFLHLHRLYNYEDYMYGSEFQQDLNYALLLNLPM